MTFFRYAAAIWLTLMAGLYAPVFMWAEQAVSEAAVRGWLDRLSPVLLLDADSRHKKCIELFEEGDLLALIAAFSGLRPNQGLTAKWQAQPERVRRDIVSILTLLNENDFRAGTILGLVYYYGLAPAEKNRVMAKTLLQSSAARGDPEAMYRLATLNGLLDQKKPAQSEAAFQEGVRAAKMGHVMAQSLVGHRYCYGLGVERDRREAEKWLVMAAENGEISAKGLAAQLVIEEGLNWVSREKAVIWLHQADDGGQRDAGRLLGRLYYLGEEVPRDWERAAAYFEKYGHNNDHGAFACNMMLADMFDKGGHGLEADRQKSLKALHRAAEQGHPRAIVLISAIKFKAFRSTDYFSGESAVVGLPLNLKGGSRGYGNIIDELKPAVEAGEPGAAELAGLMSLARWKVSKGQKQWFEQAAESGRAEAQFLLGLLYSEAYGDEGDYERARHWLAKSAASGLPEAQNALGVMYARGLGGPKDEGLAAEMFTKAASQGHQQAEVNLKKFSDHQRARTDATVGRVEP